MTVYSISLPVQEVLDACIGQVSLDFRALRSVAGAAADRSFDDFTLTVDEREPFGCAFRAAVAELCNRYSRAVGACTLTGDRFGADVTVARDLPQPMVERLLREWLKTRMLQWWYRQRNPDLWQQYGLRLEAAASDLATLFTPSCTTRKLRYF